MQPVQAEHLRQLIESSPIMSAPEKADWLDMLILMNDKQAAELEQILTAQHATVVQPAKQMPQPSAAFTAIPPLTHISNLPSNLTAKAPPKPTPPVGMAWQQQFQTQIVEKELPAPAAEPKFWHPPKPPLKLKPLKTASQEHLNHTNLDGRALAKPAPGGKVTLETLGDAGQLTLAALRRMNTADLLIRLQQLSKLEGYFNLLSYLEDSPLYKSYLATGQKVLANTAAFEQTEKPNSQMLTKAEFESFADILRKIQIN